MSETAAAASPKPMGVLARVVGVIFSPRETFAAVAAQPRWLGVTAITLAIVASSYYVILSSPEMQQAIVDRQIDAMEASGTAISDEQFTNIERFIGYVPVIYAGAILILGPAFAAVIAGLVMWIFTGIMGGKGSFRQVYAVMAHAGVVSTLSTVFVAGMMLAGVKPQGVTPPGANLGIFAPMLEETSFLFIMLRTIDLVLLWWLVTLAIGLGVLYKRKTGLIATTLIGIYAVIALIVAFSTSGS